MIATKLQVKGNLVLDRRGGSSKSDTYQKQTTSSSSITTRPKHRCSNHFLGAAVSTLSEAGGLGAGDGGFPNLKSKHKSEPPVTAANNARGKVAGKLSIRHGHAEVDKAGEP